MSSITDWETAELEFIVGAEGLNLTFPQDFKNGNALHSIRQCFLRMKEMGINSSLLTNWTKHKLTSQTVEQIREVLQSKYNHKEWLTVAQEIHDPLRELKRESLVSFLIASSFYTDEYDIYGDLLIDPEMSACMLTSRIKLAISSVQLYIQRLLLGLEGEQNRLPEDGASKWMNWMKTYRVWEANRKIFLYPENWIEPELRRTKSPFFKELEDELTQGATLAGSLEEAVKRYLNKLKEVSHLEVMATYYNAKRHLCITARTKEIPYEYYFRIWKYPNRWTPWEKMNLDIQSEHLLMIQLWGELYLFCLSFQKKKKVKTMFGK